MTEKPTHPVPCPLCRGARYRLNTESSGPLNGTYLYEVVKGEKRELARKKCETCKGEGIVIYEGGGKITPIPGTRVLPSLDLAFDAILQAGYTIEISAPDVSRIYEDEVIPPKVLRDLIEKQLKELEDPLPPQPDPEEEPKKKASELKPGDKIGTRTVIEAPVPVGPRRRLKVKVRCDCGREDFIDGYMFVNRRSDSCRDCGKKKCERKKT